MYNFVNDRSDILTTGLTDTVFISFGQIAPVRSLPTPAADSPGLYLVDNQAISTFACFNISSEGGFEIKVMKQKVWINSTNYLIQEIYGFTDSVTTPMPKAPEPAALKKPVTAAGGSNTIAKVKAQADPLSVVSSSDPSKRLSRADSIVSRVQELTKERPKRKKSNLTKLKKETVEDKDKEENEKNGGRRGSRVSAVISLDIANPERAARRSSVSSRRRMSNDSVATSAIGGAMSQAGDAYELMETGSRKSGSGEEDVEGEEDEEEEEEEEEEPNLVLLDAPECVICLSDVKDTIVLPCRHFCICSDCGDVLRRRAPQRCPICRQGKKYTHMNRVLLCYVGVLLPASFVSNLEINSTFFNVVV